jgi:site-specific DNA-methyltransferase (adenine-specific)
MIDLQHGDCLELIDRIPDNSIDLICADLPYGTTRCAWDTLIDLDVLWPKLKRIAKERAAIVLFAQTPFDKALGASNLPMLRYEWIWEKTNATGFFNAKKMPLKAHENVLVFYRKLPVYNAQKTTGHKRKTAGRKEIGSELYGKSVRKTFYDSTERYPRSVIKFKSDRYHSNLHPTQKPLPLLEYIVKTYSNEGDVVLDFCMGSGTAGVAAKTLGRSFVGIEKEKKYFDIAEGRIASSENVQYQNSISHTSKGAYITHNIRTSASEQKIIDAINELAEKNSRINKASVSRLCGISREQITRRYSYLFDGIINA